MKIIWTAEIVKSICGDNHTWKFMGHMWYLLCISKLRFVKRIQQHYNFVIYKIIEGNKSNYCG